MWHFGTRRAKEGPGGGEEGAGGALLTLPTGGKKRLTDLDGCVEYFPYHRKDFFHMGISSHAFKKKDRVFSLHLLFSSDVFWSSVLNSFNCKHTTVKTAKRGSLHGGFTKARPEWGIHKYRYIILKNKLETPY